MSNKEKIMSNWEKSMNFSLRLVGMSNLVILLLYLFNDYQPSKPYLAFNIFIIGVFCLFARYSVNEEDR